ncbi:hypothetical protein [Aeromonas dhakensis]|uniref:hypothetical protein n=1 Tax=Aeromonas dhakensis TaxID=196024 RepID=UPI00208F186D|nr:hypothetical protein [Aeromonas dhakensis]USP11556.1 hypothetical protein L1S45_08310 [Aeromonas dhakensis]
MKSHVTQKTLKQGIHWQASNLWWRVIVANLAAGLFASAQFLPHFLAKIGLERCKVVEAVVVDINDSIKWSIKRIFKRLVMGLIFPSMPLVAGEGRGRARRGYFQGEKGRVAGLLPPLARPAGSKI